MNSNSNKRKTSVTSICLNMTNSPDLKKIKVQVPLTMQPSTSAQHPFNQNQPSNTIYQNPSIKWINRVKELGKKNKDYTIDTDKDCETSYSNYQTNINIANFPKLQFPLRPRLRVLSLFDGIGTGYYALTELGYDIEVYYASEIYKRAIMVTRSHFGNNVKHLGSVIDIDEAMLDDIGPINFLIGGSPCSDLSCVNPARRGLYNPCGNGILFFEYYRILEILKKKSVINKHEFFWLFENVAHMEKTQCNIISNFLECNPCLINSLHLSPQDRVRFFWSNLEDIDKLELHIDKYNIGPLLDIYLNKNLNRHANVDKIGTITTKKGCLKDGKSRNPVKEDGVDTDLYVTEVEEIFGFPCHYTDVANFNVTQRHNLLGKAWSVQVIKQIFLTMHKYFAFK